MSNDEFATVCKDFQPTNGPPRKGCGASIIMKKYPDGKWHPHNQDGTPHKHEATPKASSPPQASTATNNKAKGGERPYYEGVTEVAEESVVQTVNSMLKDSWEILRIAEKQGYTVVDPVGDGAPGEVAAVTEIVFILGRRKA